MLLNPKCFFPPYSRLEEKMQNKFYHQKIYLSDRLKHQLAQIPHFPLTVVEAPSGFGKTTAVKEYLKETLPEEARQYWYTCLSESPSVAWAGICELFSNINIEISKNLKNIGFPTLDTLMYISKFFKDFKCNKDVYMVIDNFQLIKSNILKELISIFSMHGNPYLHIIFITQHFGVKAQMTFHNAHIHTIESSAFFFDKESTAALFKLEGIRLTDEELDNVYTITEGWVSALRLQISNYKLTGSFDYTADIDHLVETAIWNRLTSKQKDCLVSLSVLDSFTARQVALMLKEETLPEHIKDMLRHNDFIRYFPKERIYVMHSILQNYLKNQFYQYKSEAFKKRVLHTTGECCIIESDYFTAAQFFFEVKDFDAILSLPLDGIYLANKRESNMIDFLKNIINECPDKILCKYPFVLITFAYLLLMDGETEYYNKIYQLVNYVIETNSIGLNTNELKSLKGEFILLTALTLYNDINQMNKKLNVAYELLDGPSRYKFNEVPITLGGTSMLSMFWHDDKGLNETLTDMKKYLPYHIKLTHGQGIGADSALHAEIMLMRGDDIQAEILCHKALYQARSKQEICVCLCAEQILARIAILRGDVDGFFTSLDNIKNYAKDSSNLYILRMVDVCLSVISVALDTTDMIAKWFCDTESINKKVYNRAIPYVNILYSHQLIKKKRYAELLAMVDNSISMAKEMNYILPQIYFYIFKSRVNYANGYEHKAMENLEEAFLLAFPEKIYLPFAQFIYMEDILFKANISPKPCHDTTSELSNSNIYSPFSKIYEIIPNWKEDIKNIISLFNRYHKGRNVILNALNQEKSPLTPREREVAILVKARLTHNEIAEKLYISKATVRTILYNAYSKLGIHSKSELYNLDI